MIKDDTYGDSAKSRTIYILIYHVNVQINKIPQLAMGLQRERDGGMMPQGIGWGVSQTPWANRSWLDVNGETHEPSSTFVSSTLNHQFLPEVGWGS